MARLKDESKRVTILQTAKRLFSHKGFFNTSISDIVRETGMPVGTIYTYFKSKEEIVREIVEVGWQDLYTRLEQAVSSPGPVEDKLRMLIEQFIPELLNDLDLINILLSEAIHYTRLEEKIEKLTDLVFSLLKRTQAQSALIKRSSRAKIETALVVFFLGILDTVRVSRASSLGIKVRDVLEFVKSITEDTLKIRL